MLWIVSGPTSVGKSTFMSSPRCAEVTGLELETPVVFPEAQDRLDEVGSDAFYHYNILRPLALRRRGLEKGAAQGSLPRGFRDFSGDRRWGNLMRREGRKSAVVLVASQETIMRRVMERRTVETHAGFSARPEEAGLARDDGDPGQDRDRYRHLRWANLLRTVDLPSLYAAWCQELRGCGVRYVIVNGEHDSYPVVEDEDELREILGGEPDYSEAEVKAILRRRQFEYHRVELPYGLHTEGQDRAETRDLILPKSLAGKAILDVGSALGYFCFEAEARDAERVVGVELKGSRYRDAVLLGRIKKSRVEFLQRDVVADPPEESFDHVLFLNVIHHLNEPARALRQLARITNERLVVEFPTFRDKKFREGAKIRLPGGLLNRLPLVGVSSTRRGVGQTFVFTPAAIERMLTDHERLFERVEFARSPMPGRMIAFCHKGPGAE